MSVKEKLLNILEQNRGEILSGEALAADMSVSRAAIWKAVTVLRSDGHAIESVGSKGYILSTESDILSPQSISRHLPESLRSKFSFDIYKTLESTNTTAKELAHSSDEGRVIIAVNQSGGKGRLGRSFFSPSNCGLYMTIILKPTIPVSDSLLITTAAAVAVAKGIEAVTDKTAKIKWVNDIFCDNKKVCGILTEAGFDMESGGLDYAVLGIGVNVHRPSEPLPDGLEEIITYISEKPSGDLRGRLAASIIEHFWQYYQSLSKREFLDDYRQRSILLGHEITVISGDSSENATAIEITDDCNLTVKMEDGSIRTLSSGEVSVRLQNN